MLCSVILSSCQKNKAEDDDAKSIKDYFGEYSVYAMDWNKYGAKGITTVDIDGDGSNEILLETLEIEDHSKWERSYVLPKRDGKSVVLRLCVPVLDYYETVDGDIITSGNSFMFSFPTFFLNLSMNDEGYLSSDKFDRLDWPNEERIGLREFGGVQVTRSVYPYHIIITIDHYLVYDHFTSQLIDGYLTLHLMKE